MPGVRGCVKFFNSLASQIYPRPPQNLQISLKVLFPCLKVKSYQHSFTNQLPWCKHLSPSLGQPALLVLCFHMRLSEGIDYAFQSSPYAATHNLSYVQEISYIFNHVTIRCWV